MKPRFLFKTTGAQHLRSLSHHPRQRSSGVDQIGQHHPTCASCARVSQQFSLPRTRHTADSYLTMPTRAISTGEHYRVEHELHPPLRRGASYHHLQG